MCKQKNIEKNRNLSIKKLCPRALLLRIIGGAEQTLGWISFMDTDTYRVHFSVWQQSLKNLGAVVGSSLMADLQKAALILLYLHMGEDKLKYNRQWKYLHNTQIFNVLLRFLLAQEKCGKIKSVYQEGERLWCIKETKCKNKKSHQISFPRHNCIQAVLGSVTVKQAEKS